MVHYQAYTICQLVINGLANGIRGRMRTGVKEEEKVAPR